MHPYALLSTLRVRLRSLFRAGAEETQFSEEIAFHVEMETERNVAKGMSPGQARRAAMIAFGGTDHMKENRRDATGVRLFQDTVTDVRYALRWLRRAPAFTSSALLTLALGIGAVTAIFSVVNGVLLRPLPYPASEQLVAVWSRLGTSDEPATSSPPDYRELRDRSRSFSAFGAHYESAANALVNGDPHRLTVTRVSASLLPMLGATYAAGRGFHVEEEQPGRDRVVILTHATWQSLFGGRPGLVGSSIAIDGDPHVVIGITAPSFRFLDPRTQMWRPIALAATDNLNTRGNYFVNIVGRLREGVTQAAAEADLEGVVARIRADVGDPAIQGAFVVSLHEQVVGAARRALLLLLGATALLMVIACANVAGLLLARATARERELAVRAGIGASRSRLVRQLVTEALVLGAAGAALGLGIALASLRVLRTLDVRVPRTDEVAVDSTVFAVSVLLSLAAAVAFGLWPALRLTRQGHDALKAGARSSASVDHQRVRRVLVAAQVAFAMLLLIGSGLLIRSFAQVMRVDPGFSMARIVAGSLPVNTPRYDDDPPRLFRFANEVLERVRAHPDVESAAITSGLSLRGGQWGKLVSFADRAPATRMDDVPAVLYRLVSPGYFETMGVRRLRGRLFDDTDGAATQPVAIVNQAFVRRFWPDGSDPLGKVIWMAPPEELVRGMLPARYRFPRLTIVGVVADERFEAIDQVPEAEVYQLYEQSTETASTLFLAVRARGNMSSVVSHMRQSVKATDALVPLAQVATMGELVRESGGRRRIGAILVSVFGALSLVLAVVGIYGVAAQFVVQRSRELGIRLAVGASRHNVMWLVLREGGVTALAGAAVGIGGALVGARYMKEVLYGVGPTDPLTYAAITLMLFATVLVAISIPARRAARIPPASVLRGE
jgi:putative ABC transport system permease protein